MTHLLDTDHLSILERQGGADYTTLVLNSNAHPIEDVGVSVVTYHEQSVGAHDHIIRARTEREVIRGYQMLAWAIDHIRKFPSVPFDPPAAAVFDDLTLRKVRVKTLDRRIASIALANDLTLVTRNLSDFAKVPGLRTEDWTK